MKWTCIATISISCLAMEHAVGAQGPTLREQARTAEGRAIQRSTMSDPAPTSLAQLVSSADLVIRGTVESAVAYLSEDERDVLTDYRVQPTDIILPREALGVARPGQLPAPITVTRSGGSVILEGTPITMTYTHQLPLRTGMDVILILVRQGTKYTIAGSSLGAFRVANVDTVEPLTTFKQFASEHRGKALAVFVDELGRSALAPRDGR